MAGKTIQGGMFDMDRRTLIIGGAASFGALALSGWSTPAAAQDVAVDKLMADNGLPVLAIGKEDAPITIVEYASFTCPHCASFHNAVLPKLQEKYIDPGKVRLILREFPYDQFSAAVSLLARCPGGDKVLPFTKVLFRTQDQWRIKYPVPKLMEIAKQAGISKEEFEKCLANRELLDKLIKQRDTAANEFGVEGTPTFFINGKKLEGGYSLENFDKALQPLLKG